MAAERSRLKFARARSRRLAVPRANVLTDVATEYVPTHRFQQLFRNRAAKLDGQVRNAAPGVQNVRLNDSLCGAGIQTRAARSAAIRRRQVMSAECRRQFQRGQNDSDKQPGSCELIDEQRVLPEPAKARVLRRSALMNWP